MSNDDERDYAEEADVREQAVMEGALEQAAYHAEDFAGHMSGPAHYREAERIFSIATAENDRLSRTVGPVDQITAEQRAVANIIAIGQGHATLAAAAAMALHVRRNGGAEALDEALDWTRAVR